MSDVHPEYERGFRHAATQILDALDRHAIAARNGTGDDSIVAEDVIRAAVATAPDKDRRYNPLHLSLSDMADTVAECRRNLAALEDDR
ncbi:MAG: hypothetical protein M0P31_13890 [Solirubrobacteraceae bacterium]|nr:hypothetical protein [Solirubrobacteraceae bacterium]